MVLETIDTLRNGGCALTKVGQWHGSGAYLPALLTSRQPAPEWFTSAEIAIMIDLAVIGQFFGRSKRVLAAQGT